MVQKWITDLPAKTGRTANEWLTMVKQYGPKFEKDAREWLKKEYKLGHEHGLVARGKGPRQPARHG